jgi:hypothetical protein
MGAQSINPENGSLRLLVCRAREERRGMKPVALFLCLGDFGDFLPVGERSRLSFDYQFKNHPSFEDDAIKARFMVTWGS